MLKVSGLFRGRRMVGWTGWYRWWRDVRGWWRFFIKNWRWQLLCSSLVRYCKVDFIIFITVSTWPNNDKTTISYKRYNAETLSSTGNDPVTPWLIGQCFLEVTNHNTNSKRCCSLKRIQILGTIWHNPLQFGGNRVKFKRDCLNLSLTAIYLILLNSIPITVNLMKFRRRNLLT